MSSGGAYGGDFCEADGTGSYSSANGCGIVASDELWYSVTLPAGCSTLDVAITNNTTGGNLSVEILSSASNVCVPTLLEGNGCGASPTAIANFPPTTTAGKIAWIRVTGDQINEPSGTFTITPTVTSGLPAPTEDDCSSPVVISGGSTSGDNFCATASSTTDPAPSTLCATSLENTVWYQYCATSSGTFTVNFSGISCSGGASGIQAGVFTNSGGNSPSCTSSAWTALTETDATPACGSTSGSSLSIGPINMTSGTCYYIGVDGNAGAFCSYGMALGITILPIKIVSISGNALGKYNSIKWTTSSEINNQFQVLERSSNGLSNWEEVDRLPGSVQSYELKSYEMVDKRPFAVTYYRIHSIDYDGREDFSSVIYVRNSGQSQPDFFNIIPNPATENINILFNAENDSQIKINIIDIDGKLLTVDNFIASNGEQVKTIDLTSYKPGIYIMKMEINGISKVKKFIKI